MQHTFDIFFKNIRGRIYTRYICIHINILCACARTYDINKEKPRLGQGSTNFNNYYFNIPSIRPLKDVGSKEAPPTNAPSMFGMDM